MDAKIAEMEKTVKVAKDRRELLLKKKKELEEILNQTLQKKTKVLHKRILLLNKKQIIEEAFNKAKEASGATQASQISREKPDLDSLDISFERFNDLTKQLHEYSQFTENAGQMVEQMRNSFAEKSAKVDQLQKECKKIDQMVRDHISKHQKKHQDLDAKIVALKAKKRELDEKTSTLTMEVQQQQIRFIKLNKHMENLNGKFGGFMAQFQRQEK